MGKEEREGGGKFQASVTKPSCIQNVVLLKDNGFILIRDMKSKIVDLKSGKSVDALLFKYNEDMTISVFSTKVSG